MNEDDLWNLFDEIKKEEDNVNGINDNDVIKCSCGCEELYVLNAVLLFQM